MALKNLSFTIEYKQGLTNIYILHFAWKLKKIQTKYIDKYLLDLKIKMGRILK